MKDNSVPRLKILSFMIIYIFGKTGSDALDTAENEKNKVISDWYWVLYYWIWLCRL